MDPSHTIKKALSKGNSYASLIIFIAWKSIGALLGNDKK